MNRGTVGERIRQARLDMAARRGKEVTQVEVGRALGVTGVTIGRWEGGGAEPSLDLLRALATFFGSSPSWLAFGEQEPAKAEGSPAGEHLPLREIDVSSPVKRRRQS